MDRVVVCKFSKVKHVGPVALIMFDVMPEVLFKYLVDSFSLSICLGVESRGEVGFGRETLQECFPKLGVEDCSSIRHNVCREAVKSDYVLSEHLGKLGGVKAFFFVWDKVGLLGESVYKDHDRVIAVGHWKLDDCIHGDGLPGALWDRERLEWAMWLVPLRLVSGTGVATIDIGVDKGSESWEVVVSGQEFIGLSLAKVTSCGWIVYLMDKFRFEREVVRDID